MMMLFLFVALAEHPYGRSCSSMRSRVWLVMHSYIERSRRLKSEGAQYDDAKVDKRRSRQSGLAEPSPRITRAAFAFD